MNRIKTQNGLTLVELMIVTLILVPVLISVMYFFLQCMEYNDLARNTSNAVRASQNRITQIERTAFDQVFATYNNVTFIDAGINGRGVSYVDNSNPDLLKITVTFGWRQKSGRVIGEDKDLDGQIDAGEDVNGNGILDSPVVLATYRDNV